jgi:hypothetical protein
MLNEKTVFRRSIEEELMFWSIWHLRAKSLAIREPGDQSGNPALSATLDGHGVPESGWHLNKKWRRERPKSPGGGKMPENVAVLFVLA